MIHEVEGDILLSRAAVIAHGVAPHDHFASGLALALRERFPAMAKDFRHYCQVASPTPGAVWMWGGADAGGGSRRIVNLMTQEPSEGPGGLPGKASTPNVNHALRALAALTEKEAFASIALPRLATGVGGLDWPQVRPLIEQHLGGLRLPVFVYVTYRKGVQAEEKALPTV